MTVAQIVPLDLPLPQATDAERAVLGSILIVNAALYRVTGIVTASDFFLDKNRAIYVTMSLLAEEGQPIDLMTLTGALRKAGLLDTVGGYGYLTSLVDYPADVANVEKYAAMVAREARKRALVTLGNALMREAMDDAAEPEDIASEALARLGTNATREDAQARPLAEVLSAACTAQRELVSADKSEAMDCLWPTLNDHKVFYPTLIVCTADAGQGKSSLMATFARNLAITGNPTVMFSLESSPKQIALRHASQVTGIPHRFMRDWRVMSESNRDRVAQCQRMTAKLPMFIASKQRTVEALLLELRRLRAIHGVRAAFVDYVQLVQSSARFERNELMLGRVADDLLHAALDLEITICAFSQVNKEGAIAYSDAIRKSARVWLHFDRPHKDDRDRNCHVDFAILKNNEERTNAFPAHFNEVTQQWEEGICDAMADVNAPLVVQHKRSRNPTLFGG